MSWSERSSRAGGLLRGRRRLHGVRCAADVVCAERPRSIHPGANRFQ